MNRKVMGFSLIELVIVILLIGILSAIAVPRLFQSTYRAYDAAVSRFQAELVSALNVMSADWTLSGGVNKPDEMVAMTPMGFPKGITLGTGPSAVTYTTGTAAGCVGIIQYLLGMPSEYFVASVISMSTAGNVSPKSKQSDETNALWRAHSFVGKTGAEGCVFYYIKGFEPQRVWGGVVYEPAQRIPVRMIEYGTTDLVNFTKP